jgi:hypothetical protein
LSAVVGLASPEDLADSIVSQHADASSRLWRGYLTKTLDKDAEPTIANIVASTAGATCGDSTLAPTDAATSTPTDAPTDAPTSTPPHSTVTTVQPDTTAPVAAEVELSPESSASLLALAVIGLQY